MSAITRCLDIEPKNSESVCSGKGRQQFTAEDFKDGDDFTPDLNTQLAGSPRPPASISLIQYINEDVFALIVEELLQPGACRAGSLSRLSLTCRRLRYLSLPTLFSHCAILSKWKNDTTGVPPPVIRPYVRHLTYNWNLYHAQYVENYQPETVIEFGTALPFLPHVQSVTFTSTVNGVQWEGIKLCLSFPQIKSISFTNTAKFKCVPPFPNDTSSTPSMLEELCYPTPMRVVLAPEIKRVLTLAGVLVLEKNCLSALLLAMHSTARSLVLPMRTAPLRAMGTVDWPALQDLFLGGSVPNNRGDVVPKLLRHMLCRMPSLRHLVIVAALPPQVDTRCCLFSRDPSPSPWQHSLQSLVIAYPNYRDGIFSVPFSNLTYLSLRDWPRHYETIYRQEWSPTLWRSPILSATQALSILRRLHAPGLTTLELVYRADEADDELLVLIARGFPKLRHLELHRYRRSTDETVDHCHIARTLSVAPSLLRLRMNLDFKDDPVKYTDPLEIHYDELDFEVYDQWQSQLTNMGWEVLDAMETCLSLQGVALLDRLKRQAEWFWFLRGQRNPREPIRDFSEGNRDILPSSLPSKMGGRLMAY